MTLAEQVVDALLEGWFQDRWDDVKAATGIGTDSMGLGKNTEKGWKPKFGKPKVGPSKRPPALRRPPTAQTGEKTWEID